MKDRMIYITLIFSIIGVLFATFVQTKPNDNINSYSPMISNQAQSISIAISDLKYGLKGYVGYRSVFRNFAPGIAYADMGCPNELINSWINNSMKIKDVAADGRHYSIGGDLGYADYYKLAFKLFGFNIEGTTYLYLLLLGISILTFLITFYRDKILLYFLLLYNCSLYAVLTSNFVVALSVAHDRFFPIISILSVLYLAFVILGKRGQNLITITGVVIQTAILIFSIHIRASAIYQLPFLIFIATCGLFWFWKKEKSFKLALKNMNIWTLVFVLASFFAQQAYTAKIMDSSYDAVNSKHDIWHIVYVGLVQHPDAKKYGIGLGDTAVQAVVERRAPEFGYTFNPRTAVQKFESGIRPIVKNEIGITDGMYEKILMDEYLKIFKKDPWFVISSFILYKPIIYFQHFMGPNFANYKQYIMQIRNYNNIPAFYDFYLIPSTGLLLDIFKLPLLILICINCYIVRKDVFLNLKLPLIITGIAFFFALLLLLATQVGNIYMMDSGLLLGIAIYILVSRVFLKIINKWEHKEMEKINND